MATAFDCISTAAVAAPVLAVGVGGARKVR